MNILCGDALGVSCGTWIEVWSGTIGALFSAVLAAIVALAVVARTNKKQGAISKTALEAQAAEAARVRVYAAASDLVAGVDLGVLRYRQADAADDSFIAMRSAVARLELDLGQIAFTNELRQWPRFISSLQKDARVYRIHATERQDFDDNSPAESVLRRASATLNQGVVRWLQAADEDKDARLTALMDSRMAFYQEHNAVRAK